MGELWLPDGTPTTEQKREQENEQIRKAVIQFLMHRGWMRLEIEGRGPYIRTAGQLIEDLTSEVEKALGCELEEYT